MNLTYNYTASSTGAFGLGTTAGNSGELVAVSPGSTIAGAARDETFTYDDVGRLVTAAGWGAWQRSYTYDREGNRTGEGNTTSPGTQLQSISIATNTFSSTAFGTTSGPNNRIASVNGATYQYDASGNLTSDGVHTYQYDAEGRLAVVDHGIPGQEADYSYDVNNWRVKKVTSVGGPSPVTTYYVWESGRVIAEYGTAAPSNNGVRYYHPDQLSNRVITDTNAAVIGTEDTLPFGEDAGATSGAGLSDPYRFTDYNRDPESSTDYAVNRQYSSSTGRFMRPDPVVGTVLNPQTLNRYSYCASDPINKSDADGSYPRDQHEFITFVMAALLDVPGAGTIAEGAGDADNW
ncbi:MAG: RHS repeat-associated core domain-containing protein, partial [Blastocatellia bacterium]